MICNCGGITSTHKVVENKEITGIYERCNSCGRVEWTMKPGSATASKQDRASPILNTSDE